MKKKNWQTRLLSFALAGAMALSAPLGAFAATFDLKKGDITVSAEKEGDTEVHWVDQRDENDKQVAPENNDYDSADLDDESTNKKGKGYSYKKDKEIKIKQGSDDSKSGDQKESTTNTVTIKAEKDTKVDVVLDDVNIDVSATERSTTGDVNLKKDAAAVTVDAQEGSTVTLELDGTNTVKSGGKKKIEGSSGSYKTVFSDYAGIEKDGSAEETGTLIIKDENETEGKLIAAGGSNNPNNGGAGIGGGYLENIAQTGANIEIQSGTIEANGGYGAAGIGGSYGGGAAKITITGGNVTAQGGFNGAGIGSGAYGGKAGDITIDDGTVTATGGNFGAGIGGGGNSWLTGDVTINGGTVAATGGTYGAGIGSGNNAGNSSGGVAGNITINGGTVTATGNENAAGIGGGENAAVTGNIIINDCEELTATGGTAGGAGIGTGGNTSSTCLSGNITVNGGNKITASGGKYAAGIGSSLYKKMVGNITINDGNVEANGGKWGVGIGSGYAADMEGNINISGGEVKANGGTGGYAAGIGSGYNGKMNGDINISGGKVEATGGTYAAGIGTSSGGTMNGNIKISDGKVEATGGTYAAGIGTGNGGTMNGNISITGGNTTAESTAAGAGIGANTIVGNILIGGNAAVKAIGSTLNSYVGAGVGTSNWGYILQDAAITVRDYATLTAISGGKAAASIGAGSYSNSQYVYNAGTIQILDHAKVFLGIANSEEAGYIGNGEGSTVKEDTGTARYEVDCTATIAGISEQATAKTVEETFRESMTTKVWKWGEDCLGKYIHFTPNVVEDDAEDSENVNYNVTETSLDDGRVAYTNGSLTINCHDVQQPEPEVPAIDLTNTGVISSTDPAAQRWYWVTALLEGMGENPEYTYQQVGDALTVTADKAAEGAVLHVLLSGWAEHTDVQSITFVTAGKTTTIYAADILTQTSGEHLTLTHEGAVATLAVDGTDYTALLGEAAA